MVSDYEDLLQELHDGMESNIKEVNENILNTMAIAGAQEGKYAIIYYYDDEQTNLDYKTISTMSIFSD